jgi:hypothetical protein
MNTTDFQKEFEEAVEAWRQRHHLRDDDAVLLCIELFRIHQDHWDQIRRRDFPPFQEFRETILTMVEAANQIQMQTSPLLQELRRSQGSSVFLPPTISSVVIAVGASLVTGILIGRFVL